MNQPLRIPPDYTEARQPMSLRAAEALSGQPFILSTHFDWSEWQTAIQTAKDGDLSELEWMLEQDAKWEVQEERAYAYEQRTGREYCPLSMMPVGLA